MGEIDFFLPESNVGVLMRLLQKLLVCHDEDIGLHRGWIACTQGAPRRPVRYPHEHCQDMVLLKLIVPKKQQASGKRHNRNRQTETQSQAAISIGSCNWSKLQSQAARTKRRPQLQAAKAIANASKTQSQLQSQAAIATSGDQNCKRNCNRKRQSQAAIASGNRSECQAAIASSNNRRTYHHHGQIISVSKSTIVNHAVYITSSVVNCFSFCWKSKLWEQCTVYRGVVLLLRTFDQKFNLLQNLNPSSLMSVESSCCELNNWSKFQSEN